jgi:hypothetical protein
LYRVSFGFVSRFVRLCVAYRLILCRVSFGCVPRFDRFFVVVCTVVFRSECSAQAEMERLQAPAGAPPRLVGAKIAIFQRLFRKISMPIRASKSAKIALFRRLFEGVEEEIC